MPTDDGHGLKYACALVVTLIFPLCLAIPATTFLFIFGIAAVYWLWFARSYLLLIFAAIGAGFLVYMWSGYGKTLTYLAGMMIPALAISYMRKRGSSVPLALTVAILIPVLGVAFNHEFFVHILEFMSADFKHAISSQPLLPLSNLSDQSLMLERLMRLADKMIYFVPAIALCSILALYTIGLGFGNFAVRRTGMFALKISEFSLWKTPEWSIIPLGIAAIMVLTNVDLLNIVGWNLLIFFFVLYSVIGLSIVEYYMRIKRFPVLARTVMYFSLFLLQLVAAIILPLVALFDSKFDFRKVRAKRLG